MWAMLKQREPDDYVIATGETHSVRELAAAAFAHVGLDWRDFVRTDVALTRGRAQLHNLVGNASKEKRLLGWTPRTSFDALVAGLVDADLAKLSRTPEAAAPAAGSGRSE